MINDFGWALAAMKHGHEVRRGLDHPGWNPPDGCRIGIAPEHGHLTLPYVYIVAPAGRFPWTPLQWDLLAEDWVLADG